MAIIQMPALSPTMTEGKLARWLVKEGDTVSSGDVIAEIETDKALMEVEALDDGVMTSILVAEGTEGVAVGTVIAEILDDGEDSELGNVPPAVAVPEQKSEPVASPAPEKTPEKAPEEDMPPQPVAIPEKIATSAKEHQAKDHQAKDQGQRIFASPLARRIAEQKGINLSDLKGTGPHGRIIKYDVENANPAMSSAGTAAPNTAPYDPSDQSSLIPVSSTRKVIASRLQQSMQDAPHFYLNMDIELDALLAARKSINSSQPDSAKITINDLLIKCAATCLMKVPEVNVSWEGDHIRQWHHADIAVAVALESGLVTPIVWQADQKSLTSVSGEVKDLVQKAQEGRLKLNDFSGGSFTISNLGMFGISSFTAVINPPHGAILAIGAGREMPVVKDGAITTATMMTATLSCDHRVVDGAVGAKWMAEFKTIVENPMLALI
jgi:pyruvate dehydrogenase E2 component (dihydrolipoamide acetyltransferase)